MSLTDLTQFVDYMITKSRYLAYIGIKRIIYCKIYLYKQISQ